MTDFNDIYGHEIAKRALEIALVGGHSILLIGPTGQGKTMLISATIDAAAIAGIKGNSFEESNDTPDEEGQVCLNDDETVVHPNDFDIVVTLSPLSASDWCLPPPAEETKVIVPRINAARKFLSGLHSPRTCLTAPARELLHKAYESLQLTPAIAASVESVARTIAAMDGKDAIWRPQLAEAVSYVWRGTGESATPQQGKFSPQP